MQGWRIVVIYTADREKKLTAESFFQIKVYHEFSRRSSTGEAHIEVVCDVAHVTCKECPVLFLWNRETGWYRGNSFVPESLILGFFYEQKQKGE